MQLTGTVDGVAGLGITTLDGALASQFTPGALGLVPYLIAVAAVEWSRHELNHRQDDGRREQREAQEQRGGGVTRRRPRFGLRR